MVDVLLTHSNHLANDAKQLRKMQPYPPLGTLYAAAALEAAGISVAIFDTTFISPVSGFRRALQQHRPKVVAIYEDDFNFVTKMCLAHMRDLANELSEMAASKGIPVVVHGSDATDHPEAYLDRGAKYVLNGEAENTLTQLCTALLQSQEPQEIDGLVQRTSVGVSGSVITQPKNSEWTKLSRVPRRLIDLEPYRQAWIERHGYFSTNVVSSRGCPYGCNWCAKPISGEKFHIRPPEDVADEIRELKLVYGVEHVWFGDDVFALNHWWVEKFADVLQNSGEILPFKIQSRADLMSETTVAALKRAGCVEVWMGVESGSQKVLNAMGKGLKLSSVHIARERLERAGIRACYFIQFGYPGEGWSEICETIQLVRDTRPDEIGVSLSYPLPGTVFFDRVQAQLGQKRNWSDSDDLCTIFIAAYKDSFYHALRDALHAEVTQWNTHKDLKNDAETDALLWERVFAMEASSRNLNMLTLTPETSFPDSRSAFLPIESLIGGARGV